MIKPDIIEKLGLFNNSELNIFSVYLGSDSIKAPSSGFLRTQFHSLLHRDMDSVSRHTYAHDIHNITRYLDGYIPSARTIALFSSGDRLWEQASLEYSLPIGITLGNSPYLKPILGSLDHYSKYIVLLVDREKLRIFTVDQGEMVDHSEVLDDSVPQVSKSTGMEFAVGKSDVNQRHNDLLLQRHIDLLAKSIVRFNNKERVKFVIIGGHSELFKKVYASLPPGIRSKVAGTFVTEVNIPLSDIMKKSKLVAAQVS